MWNATLFKIKSNHSNLRTDVVEGVLSELPRVGTTIRIFGAGLEFGTRMIHTTEIKELAHLDNFYLCRTENSVYCVHVASLAMDPVEF